MINTVPETELHNPKVQVSDLSEKVELLSLAQLVETYVDLAFDKKFEDLTKIFKGKMRYIFKSAFGSAMLGVYTVVIKVGLIL